MSKCPEEVARRYRTVREIHRKYPFLSDGRIARLTGISRDMVRRHRLGLTKVCTEPMILAADVRRIVSKHMGKPDAKEERKT